MGLEPFIMKSQVVNIIQNGLSTDPLSFIVSVNKLENRSLNNPF